MGLREELTEPWGLITAGVAGGLGWAVIAATTVTAAPAVAIGAGIGAAVYGVKVAAATLAHREPKGAYPPGLIRPKQGSPADVWLRRAERTVRTLHDQTESPREPAVREQVGDIDDEAATVLDALRRLAAQVTSVESALHRIDVPSLQGEYARLSAARNEPSVEQMRAEQQRSLTAVEEQLDVARRLTEARDILLSKMESTAIGLEGLVARLAEVLALSATAGGVDTAHGQISDLTSELDGLRTGLAETEAISRKALGGPAAPPDLPASG
ncbi:MAG: hypothetical protein WCB04_11580 [Mycobacteriales bacterium]